MSTQIIEGRKSRRLALVTGASSGIGRAFALRLGADGYDLIAVGRRLDRLNELVTLLPHVNVRTVVADLATSEGLKAIAAICAEEDISLLVNNAGVAHYMPFTDLPLEKAQEVLQVKVITPTLLAHAAVPGMVKRGGGHIVNVAGMIAFSGPATIEKVPVRRVVYCGSLAYLVAFSQTLHEEQKSNGLQVQVLCPGIVATEFHARQGQDLSAVPRMSAEDVVNASLRGLSLGEVVCAPGVENSELLSDVFEADLTAFGGQSPQPATRYRPH